MARRHAWYHSFTVRGSVIPRIWVRVLIVFALSIGLTYLRSRDLILELPELVMGTMTGAVGIHIAFRTNSGYERFWEARIAWGAIVNRTRNIARQAHALLDHEDRKEVVLLTVAFVHASKRHFWRDEHVEEIDRLLGAERSRALHADPGPPQRTLLEIGRALRRARLEGRMEAIDLHRIEADLTTLIDQFGICQRIRNTPLPDAYVIQLRTALAITLLALPLALAGRLGWYTPPVMFVISYILIGMEQIGTELEDPFERTRNDVDMNTISANIERDLLAVCADEAGPVEPRKRA
jgi:putative membrane protein